MRIPKVLSLALALIAGALPEGARGDIVHLKSGSHLEGRATVEGDQVKVELPNGMIVVALADVDRIEEKDTILDVYDRKLAQTPANDAQAQYELGLWCALTGLDSRASGHHREAIAIDPDHVGARKELGYVAHQGKWIQADTLARIEEAERALREAAAAGGNAQPVPGPKGGAVAGGASPPGGAPNPGPSPAKLPKLSRSIRPTGKFVSQYFAGRWPWLGSPQYGRIYWAGPYGAYGPSYFGPYSYDGAEFYGYGSGVSFGGGAVGGGFYSYGSSRASSGLLGFGSSSRFQSSGGGGGGLGGFAFQYRHGKPGDSFFFDGLLSGHSFSSGGFSSQSLGTSFFGGFNFGGGSLNFSFNP